MHRKRALAASLIACAIATAGATAITPAATANVQVGASGWQWGNPLPQGNTLRSASFAGTTGYAAGDVGTLLKTTDGGSSWSGLPVGTFENLALVQALDAETVFAGGGCVARRSVDGGRTFTAMAFTPVESSCRSQLRSLSFVTPTLGWLLLSDGTVFATDDGGASFAQRTALPGTGAGGGGAGQPVSIAFTSATTGTASTSAGLFRTTDAGASWRAIVAPPSLQLWFADAQHGYAVGGPNVLRTDDGGATWTPKELGVPGASYSSIRCSGDRLCVLSTADGGALVRTTDGGETPGERITPSSEPIYTAAFASPTRIAALGARGATVVSDDAGATFAPIGGALAGSYSGVFAGAANGCAFAVGGNGGFAKTSDGGRAWTRGSVPTAAALRAVSFPSAQVGYALDGDGGLFRTANGGSSWKTLGTGSTARSLALLAPSEQVVLTAGGSGLRRSADGGGTFSPVRARAAARRGFSGIAAARDRTIFAWGAKTLVRSGDAGRTWTAVTVPGTTRKARAALRIRQVAAWSRSVVLLLDANGRVWRTANGGRAWEQQYAIGASIAGGLAVASANAAYVVRDRFDGSPDSYLLHTTDGGRSWQPQFVVRGQIGADGIAAGRGGTDYLLAGDSQLLATTTGGSAGERSQLTLSGPQRTLRDPGRVTIRGRLRPAGSARVVVAAQVPGGAWTTQRVDVAANGTFVSSWRIPRGTTRFVAQWSGSFSAAGAGSRVLVVKVGPKPRAARRAKRRAHGRR